MSAAPHNAPTFRNATRESVLALFTRTTWIAAGFCLLVCSYTIYQHVLGAERDPWKSPQLLGLKDKLRITPTDEAVKQEIRRLDLEFRQRYVRRLSLNRTAGWMLVGGVATMLLAAQRIVKVQTQPWFPKLKSEDPKEVRKTAKLSRLAVTGIGVVVGVSLLVVGVTARSPMPNSAAELEKLMGKSNGEAVVATVPTLLEFEANWPQFRGFGGCGYTKQEVSLDTNAAGGVIWKSAIAALGFNSPVVWHDRVFISGGNAVKREVLCFNSADGKILWRRTIENTSGPAAKPSEIPDATGWAAPTMAADGERAFTMFANGDLAAINFDGTVAWVKHIGTPKNAYGHASSLAIWPGKLIVQMDQDEGAPGGSKLVAFDCFSGRQLWEHVKPTHSSWASPIIVQAAGQLQVITLALPLVMSSALDTGSELWRADLLSGEITPSPIFAGGLVVAVNPSGSLVAIRPDGNGDVGKSHIAWTIEDNIPDVTSPVSNGELVFTVTSLGSVACFNLQDGKKVWVKDLDMEVQSSPAIAGGRLVLLSTKGDLVSVAVAREFKELSRIKLADTFHASPAFSDRRMFLRGATNLWCLGTISGSANAN